MSFLTKTAYLAFCKCSKAYWLQEYQPHIAAPPDPASQRRLRAGQEVDKLAQGQFVNGRLIPPHFEDMASLTTQAIANGEETLFQATFIVDDLLIKADVLTKTESGWHLIEVKSGTKAKVEHIPDAAFQVYVLQKAGLNVTQASIMHLNSDCRHPDLSNLFAFTDITNDVWSHWPQVEMDVDAMRRLVVSSDAPDVGIGRHCTRPNTCPFYDHCWQHVNGLTIYDIPRLSEKKERPLQDAGVLYLADIPSDCAITASQRAFVDSIVQEQVNIDHTIIQQSLASLEYPLYFFDFETIDYAVPSFEGCKPYQQVPFQYSCHILDADGALTHCDYLHTGADDPRRPLTESLLNHIGETGHLIAYNIPFERGVLRHLAEQFPEHAQRLTDMADRLWDQLTIFRKHYRHYGFGKSNSLKSVLPVVVPALSYKLLDVQDGVQAQVVWEEMIGVGETAVKTQLADQLRDYCHLDTLAMVEIHDALSNL